MNPDPWSTFLRPGRAGRTRERTAVAYAMGAWRTAAGSASGDCVETAPAWRVPDGLVCAAVRDSKDPDGPMLILTAAAWRHLITTIKEI